MDIRYVTSEKQILKGVKPPGKSPTRRPPMTELPEPTFDSNGQPTEETLCVIRDFPKCHVSDARPLLEFLLKAWGNEFWAKEARPGFFVFDCGGCSRNEALIDALRQSAIWSELKEYALSLRDDGLLIIGIAREAMEEIKDRWEEIEKWAWNR